MNLFEEQPDVMITEWSCFPSDSEFWEMHDWRRCEKRVGSDQI